MTTDPKLEDLLADDTFNSGEEFCIVYLYIYSVLLFYRSQYIHDQGCIWGGGGGGGALTWKRSDSGREQQC